MALPKGYRALRAFGLDSNGADQMGEREVALPAGGEGDGGGGHCRGEQGRRSRRLGGYGPRFSEPRTSRERGRRGELAPG